MKKMLFLLLLTGALRAEAQIVQSAVTSVTEERVVLAAKYRGWAEAGIGANITDALLTWEVTTTHGIQLSSGLFLGAGIGFFGNPKQTALPLYLNGRQFLGRHRDRGFFLEARLGYNCSLKASSNEIDHFKLKGLFFSPGAGITWKRVNLSVDYLLHRELQQLKIESKGGYPRYKSCLQLRVGVNF